MCASRLGDPLKSLNAYGIGYRLRATDPNTRAAFARTCISMQAALEQGSMLSRSGYHIEIWSPAFLEAPPGISVH
jgi:hypothetical protein